MKIDNVKKGFYFYDGKNTPTKIANNLADLILKLKFNQIDYVLDNQDMLDNIMYAIDNRLVDDIQKNTLNYYNVYQNPTIRLFQKLNIYKFGQDANIYLH